VKITGTTRIFTIMAHPSTHVTAPAIFNHIFEILSLDMAYIAHDTTPEAVQVTLSAYRVWNNLGGFNVTIPHKESVGGLLDRLLPPASSIGVVNTVVRSPEGVLTGYNTDGVGAVKAIGDVHGARCLMIGAGGAARAVVDALLKAGAGRVSILNRTPERSLKLIRCFPAGAVELFNPDMLQDTDVVVQATPIVDHVPLGLDIRGLRAGTRVLEMVMKDTALSREALRRGLVLIPGYRMLYHQTQENFRLLTGVEVSNELISRAFRAAGFCVS